MTDRKLAIAAEQVRRLCFQRVMQYLWVGADRTPLKKELKVLFFWRPKRGKPVRNSKLSIHAQAPTLLGVYRRELRRAVEGNDARLAGLLGFSLGLILAELRVSEIAQIGRLVKKGGAKGGRKIANLRKPLQKACADRIDDALNKYLRSTGKTISLENAREAVIRPLIERLLVSNDSMEVAIARKLMGRSGLNSDGILSAKQLKRLIRNAHPALK